MLTHISFHLFDDDDELSGSDGEKVKLMSEMFFRPNWPLTVVSLIRNDDPEVDGLLRSELLVVPLLLHPNGAVCFDRHPRIVVADLESFTFGFLLQLEDVAAFGVSIGLGEFDPFSWSDGARHASLLSSVLLDFLNRRRFFLRRFLSDVFQVDHHALMVGVCNEEVVIKN